MSTWLSHCRDGFLNGHPRLLPSTEHKPIVVLIQISDPRYEMIKIRKLTVIRVSSQRGKAQNPQFMRLRNADFEFGLVLL
jgi:hypothetical protein